MGLPLTNHKMQLIVSLTFLSTFAFASYGSQKNIFNSALRVKGGSSSSSIAVFGGSGLLGAEVVHQHLSHGGPVSTLIRNRNKFVIPKGSGGSKTGEPIVGAHVVEGDITKTEDVEKVFEGQKIDGVIICVGGKTKKNGPTMCTDGTKCVIESCKKYGVKRISVVTSIGCGDSSKHAPFFFKLIMKTMMKKIFADKNNQEKLFLDPSGIGHDLEYVIVRPAGMTLDEPNGIVLTDDEKAGTISRADVGSFLLRSVTEKEFPFIGKVVSLSSDRGSGWTKDRTVKAQGVRED